MDHATVLQLLGVVAGVLAVAWAAAAMAIGPRRPAAWHWAAANLIFCADILIIHHRAALPGWIAFTVPNLSALLAFVLLRRGIQHAIGLPRTDREHVALVGLAAPMALAVEGPGVQFSYAVALCCLAIAWILFRAAVEAEDRMRAELGAGLATVVGAPMVLFCFVYLIRGSMLVLRPESEAGRLDAASMMNSVLAVALFVVLLSFNLSLAAIAISKLTRRLRELAQHDTLTGLFNRRVIDQTLAREGDRRRARGGRTALLVLDIDLFKRINDAHGHPAGDAVLVAVAGVMRRCARKVDMVGRLGGEEFCVLLSDVAPEGAMIAAERYRKAIADTAFAWQGTPIPVTVSIGVAVSVAGGETEACLLGRADQALYRAKQDGRNRAVLADIPPPAAGAGLKSAAAAADIA